MFTRPEIALRTRCRQRTHELHAPLAEWCEHMVVSWDLYLETIGVSERGFNLPPISAARYAAAHLAPADRRVRHVVVQKLSPLHQQHRVVFGRGVDVLRERNAHLPRARQRRPIGRSRPRRINSCESAQNNTYYHNSYSPWAPSTLHWCTTWCSAVP